MTEGPSEYEAYAGGFGYSFASPFAVPQEGFLLFASSSIRSMPGGTKLRKAGGSWQKVRGMNMDLILREKIKHVF